MQLPRSITACLLGILATIFSGPVGVRGQEPGFLQHAHAWGRFSKGSWRQVRVMTENLDEQGKLASSSTTDNLTTVEDVTPERVTLKVALTVEIAGQRVASEPQIVKQGYAGESFGQTVSVKPLPSTVLMIDGREIACEVQQIEILGAANREVSLIHYSPRLTPAILKRKSTVTDVASSKTTQETTSEVKALDMSLPVLDEIGLKNAYLVRVEQKNDHGTTMTWSWHVPDVPGEVVAQASKKLDKQGRLVRRSTLQLVGYGEDPDDPDDASRDPGVRRARRHKRNR